MKEKEYQEKMNSIQEKIGKESSNLILDEIAILLNDNKKMNQNEENQAQEIERLKKTNETLQNINGNLLQQVSVGIDKDSFKNKERKEENEDKNKSKFIDFKDCFDENGNFKK